MKSPFKSVLTLVGSLLAAGLFAAQTATLTILHTNDTHGHLLPFSYPNILPDGSQEAQMPVRTDIGGIARRATLVKQIRAELKKSPVWFVDCGDFLDGTPFSTEFHGDADNDAMNAAGYDFGILGNHEFNNSVEQLQKLIANAKRQLVCANAFDPKANKPLTSPYKIVKIQGLKIGVFGLITESARTYPASKDGGIRVDGELDTAQKIVKELKPKVDIVVLLSHIGVEDDVDLAKKVKGIDVIVGGHSHTRLPIGMLQLWSDQLIPDQVNGTVIAQAHQWGGELGRLDLLFGKDKNGKWHVTRYRERLIPVTAKLNPDPLVASAVDKYWSKISAKYAEVVGQAEADFSERGDDMAEYNLVADAMRESLDVQFDLENLGGVRSPLVKGPITQADLVTMDPFNNTMVTFDIKGSDLKKVLLKEQPSVSGIQYRIEWGRLIEVTIDGKPIEDDAIYHGAANSYFAAYALKDIKVTDTGKSRVGTLIEYVRSKGTIKPRYDGRRVVIE
jgi:2',3'-cyclic-nucleotide 2'-phosphodiesterase (5'-nucleotidase family)